MNQDYEFEIKLKENEIAKTALVILPLRERKLVKLKNRLKEENARLAKLHKLMKKGERRLTIYRHQYKNAIEDFAKHHTGVILMHEKLFQTLEAEKLCRANLMNQEAENQEVAEHILKQGILIESINKEIKDCQKEIEKIEVILSEKGLL